MLAQMSEGGIVSPVTLLSSDAKRALAASAYPGLWNRHGLFVSLQPRSAHGPTGLTPLERTIRSPRPIGTASTTSAGRVTRPDHSGVLVDAAATDTGEEAEEVMERVVRPAISWLYGWIDTQIHAAEQDVPEFVQREHLKALSEATREVSAAMGEHSNEPAEEIWASLVEQLH